MQVIYLTDEGRKFLDFYPDVPLEGPYAFTSYLVLKQLSREPGQRMGVDEFLEEYPIDLLKYMGDWDLIDNEEDIRT